MKKKVKIDYISYDPLDRLKYLSRKKKETPFKSKKSKKPKIDNTQSSECKKEIVKTLDFIENFHKTGKTIHF